MYSSVRNRSIDLRFAFDSLGGGLKGPGEKQRERQAKPKQRDNDFDHPIRRLVYVEDQCTELQDDPGSDYIRDGDAEDVTALEFVK